MPVLARFSMVSKKLWLTTSSGLPREQVLDYKALGMFGDGGGASATVRILDVAAAVAAGATALL